MATVLSFDGTEAVKGDIVRPTRKLELLEFLSSGGPVIPRGSGLSYCHASAGAGVRSISSSKLDRILDFDPERGTVVAEPGVRVGDVAAFALARGWLPPVLPGHPAITVGGCVGFNVHGKSPSPRDHFIDCVEELEIVHPDHGELACSRSKEPDLFELTLGGFGLTGFVTRVKLRLERLPGAALRRERLPVPNLIEAVETMEKRRAEVAALYSWNDLNRRGDAFGRGFVYAERFEESGAPPGRQSRGALTAAGRARLPWALLGRWNARAFTRAYGILESLRPGSERVAAARGLFPIRGKEIYFALFGRRGFREYQMLLPRASWALAVESLERLLASHRAPTTLGSLKLFAGQPALLRFSGSGVCLTLDAPAWGGAPALFAALDELVVELGGIVNLSKDGRIDESLVRRVYPEYEIFRERLHRFDPRRRFDSSLRRRLGL